MQTHAVGVYSAVCLMVGIAVLVPSGTDWGIPTVLVGVASSTLALTLGEERAADSTKSVVMIGWYAFVGTAIGTIASAIVGSFLGIVGEGEGWEYLVPAVVFGVIAALAAGVTGLAVRRLLPLDVVTKRAVALTSKRPGSGPFAETVGTLGKSAGGGVAVVTGVIGLGYWLLMSMTAHPLLRVHRNQFFADAVESLPDVLVAYGELVIAPIFDPFVSATFGLVFSLVTTLAFVSHAFAGYAIVRVGVDFFLIPEWLLED